MTRLRKLDRLREIARRIVHGVDEVYQAVQHAKQDDVVVKHQHAVLKLPERIVTEAEYKACKAEAERLKASPGDGRGAGTPGSSPDTKLKTDPHPTHATPVSVLRIGETVLCTNQFELYTDYAIQMKARSKAVQTFVVQLANGAAAPQPPAGFGRGQERLALRLQRDLPAFGAGRQGRRIRRRHSKQRGWPRRRTDARGRNAEDDQRHVLTRRSAS